MVKYKVNLNFKDNGKSLNEIITNVLKIELEKQFYNTCNKTISLETSYFQNGSDIS